MGPQLLIDKSAIQALSSRESALAHTYFYIVYAPTLFIEILGDIRKRGDNAERARKEVAKANSKLMSISSCYTCHYQIAIEAELSGNIVPMDGRPLKLGGQPFIAEDGKRGVFFEEEPERAAHRRWERGEFIEAERHLSERWRQSTKNIDLNLWTRDSADLPKASSISEARELALQIARDARRQEGNLHFLLSAAHYDEAHREQLVQRWIRKGMPDIEGHAPYVFFCLVAFLSFYICIANSLVGTRATNLVDLEYVLYLPFAKYFTSGDKFHRDFVPHFMNKDQNFIHAVDLKADLRRISDYFESMDEEARKAYYRENGPYPPNLADSLINDAWVKHAKPRDTHRHIEITPKLNDKLMEHFKPMLDAIRKRRPK